MNYIDAATLPLRNTGQIRLHGSEGFEGMRRAGQLAARCLDMLIRETKPGVTTQHLNDLTMQFALDHGAYPATLYYRGYHKVICTSINHVVCHGIPDNKPLDEGDIVNLDVTLILDGWHGDTSRMVGIGNVSRKAERLMDVTHEAMMRGIAVIRPGARLYDIGKAIQTYAEGERCSVVRDFCGHGIGRLFHDTPNILHYAPNSKEGMSDTETHLFNLSGIEFREGMIFTVEPMINLGRADVKVLKDGWTAVTRDRSLSAQFEHTVGVTKDGVEIFTLSPTGLHKPPYNLTRHVL
jgi:methionyl aminopeptidase